jgi:hypothetical protein
VNRLGVAFRECSMWRGAGVIVAGSSRMEGILITLRLLRSSLYVKGVLRVGESYLAIYKG